jgi:hypothetical protein
MTNAYVIEQKEFNLQRDTRSNLILLSFILFVLIVLKIPYVDDPLPRGKFITRFANETQELFDNPQALHEARR